jgi:hypothetical protein
MIMRQREIFPFQQKKKMLLLLDIGLAGYDRDSCEGTA